MPFKVERKRVIAIVVSLVLLLALILLFSDPWSMFRRESGRIVLQDPAVVDLILVRGHTDSVMIARTGGKWYLEGNLQANQKAVENLLYAASRISISSSVPSATLPAGATRRQVSYGEGDRTLLEYTFIAAGGKFLVRPAGSELAYYVDLPGYAGLDLEKVFSDDRAHYLDRILISMKPSEIAMIRIERGGSDPFFLVQDSLGNVSLYREGKGDVAPEAAGSLDELSIRLLFSYFTTVRHERRSGIPVDSLTARGKPPAIARILVRSHSGEEHALQVFPYREGPGEDPHMFLALAAFDREPEALVVNYIYLDVLMRPVDHYLSGE